MRVADEGFEVRGFVVQIRHVDRPTDQPYDRTTGYITTAIRRMGEAHQARVTRLWSPRYSCTTTKLHYCSQESLRCFSPGVSDSLPGGFLQFHLARFPEACTRFLASKEAESRLSSCFRNDPRLSKIITIGRWKERLRTSGSLVAYLPVSRVNVR